MKETMRKGDIAFALGSAFLFGVLVHSFELNGSIALLGAFLALAAAAYFVPRRMPLWFAGAIVAAFFFGMWRLAFFTERAAQANTIPIGTAVTFSGVVDAEPKIFEKAAVAHLALLPPYAGECTVVGEAFLPIAYGDVLSVNGAVSSPPYAGAPPEAVFPDVTIAEHGRIHSLKGTLIGTKGAFVRVFQRSLPKDLAALLSGITFGARADFTSKFKSEMAASGTTHLVALSGYNISILVVGVGGALGRFLRRRATFFLTLAVIALFVAMVGNEASVVRAAIMGAIVLLAEELGRMQSMRNAVALTAAGMVFANPTILTHDMGFILSFASLLGIVYLMKPLARAMRVLEDMPGFWKEQFLTTLAAQLAVAPLLALSFGNVSLTAILTNVLVLGAVPFTMALGFLVAAVGIWFGALATLLSWVVAVPLGYMRAVIAAGAALPIPLGGMWNSWAAAAAYYAALLLLIFWHRRKIRAAASSQL